MISFFFSPSLMAHYLEDLGGVVVLPVYIICKRPFFANKNVTFAKLSRTPRLSVAGPMLGNNASYEDSFTACQITPENHGSLLDSPLNMQLASRNLFSGQIAADYSTPFNMHFDFRPLLRKTFAALSRKYPYSQTPDPGHQQGSH